MQKTVKCIFSNIVHVCISVFCLFISGCNINAQTLEININRNKAYQTMEGFGASDAWRCQFVGANWPKEKKERIAELLFSKDLDENGNPKGIGLSIWRFYIGAGTAEQGEASGIKNEWRRAESFVDANGNYNWKKHKGQQWFLQKAKSYGVEKFLAFSISAPVHWTKNGKGYNSDLVSGALNLKEDKYDDYAAFMVEVLKHFKSQGINFNYLSPINEPQWEWEKKTQEGTPATNADISRLTQLLNAEIDNSNLDTQLTLAEAADLRWLYSEFNKSKRGNQIEYFFGESGTVKAFPHVKNVISGHSYFTTWPVDSLVSIRQKLNDKLQEHDVDYWQSEFCILENTDDIGGGRKRDLGMDTALYVARVIHADITLANASSWQWWTALTNADYKDGLIYLDTGNQRDLFKLDNMKSDGNFHDSKLLWAVGNYSRFIRPGMTRVKINLNDEDKTLIESYKNLMLSAYVDEKTSKLVIVAINYGSENQTIDFSEYEIDSKFETSEAKNLEFEKTINKKIKIKGRTINTLIGSLPN